MYFYGYINYMRTGRPPKKTEDKRTEGMKIPLSESEKDLIKNAAAADESKPVTWARDILIFAAKRRMKNGR